MIRIWRVLLVLGLVFAIPAAAGASPTQEASFQDNRLLLADPAQLDQTLQTLKQLGVDRLRISVVWYKIAPDSTSRQKPQGFDASDPAAYPAANWAPYDTIVTEAAKYGMGVNFDLMGGAPLWAVGRAPSASMTSVWYPSASAFGAFAAAVGTRYSGNYTPPGASSALPAVTYWSIWNEPNVGSSSLSPQTVGGVEVAPRLYRSLANAAYGSLLRTGHPPGPDTILVGELASTGHVDPGLALGMQPLRFLRALYCVGSNYRPLRGAAAAARGCPTDAAGARSFRADNPVLFDATGWSHHPYDLTMAPSLPPPPAEPDWVTFANLPKLEHALDRIQLVYGSQKKFPIYLTEYGFETNPPKATFAISPALQALYLNEGEYMAWRDPRVQALSQYLLQDAQPINRLGGQLLRDRADLPQRNEKAVVRCLPAAALDPDREGPSRGLARGMGMPTAGEALPASEGRSRGYPARWTDCALCRRHQSEGLLRRTGYVYARRLGQARVALSGRRDDLQPRSRDYRDRWKHGFGGAHRRAGGRSVGPRDAGGFLALCAGVAAPRPQPSELPASAG